MSTMVACAGDQKAESDGTGETFVLGPSEVFLQPATDVGPEPFVITPLAPAPDPELARPVVAEEAEVQSAAGAAIQASSGSQPGLYGGSRDDATCDTEQLVSFLGANPDKAQAWVAALNADATLRYEGGQLTPSVIPQYIGGLTPLILLEDTRVTNHGFADGKPNPWQSVLQKGTAVLIDQYGVPRARCYCGNPLIAPIPAPSAPTYVGRQWADFDPTKVDVVSPAPEPIEIFQVQDKTGAIVERPRSGSEDPFSAIEDSLSESTEPAEAQPASESTEAVQEALPGESYAVESYGDQVTGRISMKVPTDWEVVDDFVVYDDPGVAGQVLATAPDAEKITNPEESWTQPALVLMHLWPSTSGATVEPATILDVRQKAPTDGCSTYVGRGGFDHPSLGADGAGMIDQWSGCGDADARRWNIAFPMGDGSVALIQLNLTSPADEVYLAQALESLKLAPPPSLPAGLQRCTPDGASAGAQMTLENTLDEPVRIIWWDRDCNAVDRMTLEPGEVRTGFPTYEGNEFSAITFDGRLVSDLTVDPANPTWTIK